MGENVPGIESNTTVPKLTPLNVTVDSSTLGLRQYDRREVVEIVSHLLGMLVAKKHLQDIGPNNIASAIKLAQEVMRQLDVLEEPKK